MCLQCATKAVNLRSDILPGFSLMQAVEGTSEWPAGWYGLVERDDPTVIFPGPILGDPTEGLSDEDLNAMADFPEGYNDFTVAADALGDRLVLPASAGFRLVTACVARGYNIDTDGFLHYWLMKHLAAVMSQPHGA